MQSSCDRLQSYRRLFIVAFYVPTLNRCSTIYERCLDLSAYLKLSGAPGTWLLRLYLVYIQTSGSSDMPYMICDVLVVFLERHILSHVLSLFCKFSHRLCIAYFSRFHSGPVEFSIIRTIALLILCTSRYMFIKLLPYSEPNVTR